MIGEFSEFFSVRIAGKVMGNKYDETI